MLGIPVATPMFGDLLEALTGVISDIVGLHSQIQGKKALVEAGGIHLQASLHSLLPMKSHTEYTLASTVKMQQHVSDISA